MENEEILFKCETNLNKESLKEFSKFISLKYNKSKYWTLTIIFAVLLLLCIIALIYQINFLKISPKTSIIIFRILFITTLFIMLKLGTGAVKINEKSLGKINYEFTNDYMFIFTELSSQKILYSDISIIRNVCNTEKYIYFMTSTKTGLILDKAEIKQENKLNFIKYLQDKFKDKFQEFK